MTKINKNLPISAVSDLNQTSYQKLEKVFRRLSQLDHALAFLGWDEAVGMPAGGGMARAESTAELRVLRHEILTSDSTFKILGEAEADLLNKPNSLSLWPKANLREIRTAVYQARSISPDLVEAQAIATSKCEHAWRLLRKDNDWKSFLPLFKEVVQLGRTEARERSKSGGKQLYDSLLELHCPGMSALDIGGIFEKLKVTLPTLTAQIIEKQKSRKLHSFGDQFSKQSQIDMAQSVMARLGFDFEHGRLDESSHPFAGGVPRDVRVTTRYFDNNFSESLMGVIHETGHAQYEQNLPKNWLYQPVGAARGMHIHESQSLMFEMQLGRSFEFISSLHPLFVRHLANPRDPNSKESSQARQLDTAMSLLGGSDHEQIWSIENLHNFFTRVEAGYIRVSADEVTYPAHVILRFEIEKALMEGEIEAEDIPNMWDERMKKYLGLSTLGNDRDGCMQDIHWPMGSFGYFPSYTLGALIAAQLFAAIQRRHPKIKTEIAAGNLSTFRSWLKENVWEKGCLLSTQDLLVSATGEGLNSDFFLEHVKQRYLDLGY